MNVLEETKKKNKEKESINDPKTKGAAENINGSQRTKMSESIYIASKWIERRKKTTELIHLYSDRMKTLQCCFMYGKKATSLTKNVYIIKRLTFQL